MTKQHAIDTALVYLDKVTVTGVSNILALAHAIDALIISREEPESDSGNPENKVVGNDGTN